MSKLIIGVLIIVGAYAVFSNTCQSRNEFIIDARSVTGFESICKNVLK